MLEAAHDDLYGACHLGLEKTYGRLRERFYWRGMYKDVHAWIQTCKLCQMKKQAKPVKVEGLVSIKPVFKPWDLVALDAVGPLPLTYNGNKYVLSFIDYATRWPESVAVPDIQAETAAKVFIEKILCRYSAPRRLLTDRGSNFRSNFMKSVLDATSTRRLLTTSYHPQCDGLLERLQSSLFTMLSFYVGTRSRTWDDLLQFCVHGYNTSPQSSMGNSPYYLLYGMQPALTNDIQFPNANLYPARETAYTAQLVSRLNEARATARRALLKSQAKQQKYYNRNSKKADFPINSLVLMWTRYPQSSELGRKFYPHWQGPYVVLEKQGPVNYKIIKKDSRGAKPDVVHANRIKAFRATVEDLDDHQLVNNVAGGVQTKEEEHEGEEEEEEEDERLPTKTLVNEMDAIHLKRKKGTLLQRRAKRQVRLARAAEGASSVNRQKVQTVPEALLASEQTASGETAPQAEFGRKAGTPKAKEKSNELQSNDEAQRQVQWKQPVEAWPPGRMAFCKLGTRPWWPCIVKSEEEHPIVPPPNRAADSVLVFFFGCNTFAYTSARTLVDYAENRDFFKESKVPLLRRALITAKEFFETVPRHEIMSQEMVSKEACVPKPKLFSSQGVMLLACILWLLLPLLMAGPAKNSSRDLRIKLDHFQGSSYRLPMSVLEDLLSTTPNAELQKMLDYYGQLGEEHDYLLYRRVELGEGRWTEESSLILEHNITAEVLRPSSTNLTCYDYDRTSLKLTVCPSFSITLHGIQKNFRFSHTSALRLFNYLSGCIHEFILNTAASLSASTCIPHLRKGYIPYAIRERCDYRPRYASKTWLCFDHDQKLASATIGSIRLTPQETLRFRHALHYFLSLAWNDELKLIPAVRTAAGAMHWIREAPLLSARAVSAITEKRLPAPRYNITGLKFSPQQVSVFPENVHDYLNRVKRIALELLPSKQQIDRVRLEQALANPAVLVDAIPPLVDFISDRQREVLELFNRRPRSEWNYPFDLIERLGNITDHDEGAQLMANFSRKRYGGWFWENRLLELTKDIWEKGSYQLVNRFNFDFPVSDGNARACRTHFVSPFNITVCPHSHMILRFHGRGNWFNITYDIANMQFNMLASCLEEIERDKIASLKPFMCLVYMGNKTVYRNEDPLCTYEISWIRAVYPEIELCFDVNRNLAYGHIFENRVEATGMMQYMYLLKLYLSWHLKTTLDVVRQTPPRNEIIWIRNRRFSAENQTSQSAAEATESPFNKHITVPSHKSSTGKNVLHSVEIPLPNQNYTADYNHQTTIQLYRLVPKEHWRTCPYQPWKTVDGMATGNHFSSTDGTLILENSFRAKVPGCQKLGYFHFSTSGMAYKLVNMRFAQRFRRSGLELNDSRVGYTHDMPGPVFQPPNDGPEAVTVGEASAISNHTVRIDPVEPRDAGPELLMLLTVSCSAVILIMHLVTTAIDRRNYLNRRGLLCSPVIFLVPMFYIVAAATPSVPTSGPLICSTKGKRYKFHLADIEPCKPYDSPLGVANNTQIQIYKKSFMQYESSAHKCMIIRKTISTFMYWAGVEKEKKEEVVYEAVSREECQQMILGKKCSVGEMVPVGSYWTTNKPLFWEWGGHHPHQQS